MGLLLMESMGVFGACGSRGISQERNSSQWEPILFSRDHFLSNKDNYNLLCTLYDDNRTKFNGVAYSKLQFHYRTPL